MQTRTHTRYVRCSYIVAVNYIRARGSRGIQRNTLVCASSDRADKVSDVITFRVVRLPIASPCDSQKSPQTEPYRVYLQRENATNESDVRGL